MRKIGIVSATAVGLGAIIGAGIFVLSGTAIALAGHFALLAFILVGLVSLIMALVLSELSSIMPSAKGASYSYAYAAFGSEIAFITGILLYASYATGTAAIALGFGSYLSFLLGLPAGIAPGFFAVLLIIAIAAINIFGIRKAAITDLALVLVKMAILLAFIGFALYAGGRAGTLDPSTFLGGTFNLNSFFNSTIAIFFAYTGFQAITTFISGIEGGSRSATKAIVGSVLISIVIYALVVVSLMLLAPSGAYAGVADPLAVGLQRANAPPLLSLIVDIGALVATTSAALAYMLSASRIVYQISADRLLPGSLRGFDRKRDVAVGGVALSAFVAILALLFNNIFIIAAVSNFGLIFSYIIACVALMHFRKTNTYASYRMPLYPYLPVFAIVSMFAFLIGMPSEALTFGLIAIIALIVIYHLLREVKKKKVIRVRLFE